MSLLRDLNDYKLETEFDTTQNQVIHRSYRADWAYGRGRIAVEERWTSGDVVGTGAFGVVRLETQQDASGGSSLGYRAVKQLRKLDMRFKKVDFHKELLALTKFSREKFIRSQAFVQFLGWFEDNDHVYLAMEYFENGTLDKYITEALSERDSQIIAHQLLLGLKIMHQEHFAHRDMKPNNIFVVQHAPNWWVKIGDFGISKRVATDTTALHSIVGTPQYIAPEVFQYVPAADDESDVYTNAVDVWSFACVLYEMLALCSPFSRTYQLLDYCRDGEFPNSPLEARTSPEGVEFVRRILIPHPAERPDAETILEYPWLRAEIKPKLHTSIKPAAIGGQREDTEHGKAVLSGYSISSVGSGKTIGSSQIRNTTRASELSNTFSSLTLAEDDKKSDQCSICSRALTDMYHHCSSCAISLCVPCVGSGHHCNFEDHWLVKRSIKSGIVTETAGPGSTWELYQKDKPTLPPAITLSSRRWRKSYKSRKGGGTYDYCSICRATFLVDEPYPRHEWELHETLHRPTEVRERYSKAEESTSPGSIWVRRQSPEDDLLQKDKLMKMEEAMMSVFNQKVVEKEDKLKTSEQELYARHREMKEALNHTLEKNRSYLAAEQIVQAKKEARKGTESADNPKRKSRWFPGLGKSRE